MRLYGRIMIWLSIPLFCLGAIFTAIQLTNQINALNQINQIRSEFAFQGIQKILTPFFLDLSFSKDFEKVRRALEKTQKIYQVPEMDVYSILDNAPLFPEIDAVWSLSDLQAMEENLYLNGEKKSLQYSVKIDKGKKQLLAFIPFEGRNRKILYFIRAVFPLSDLKTAIAASRWTLGTILFFIFFIGFIIAQGLARSIVRPISLLNQATMDIMRGNFDQNVQISTKDEIQVLAERFNEMGEALKQMQKQAQDANPLTGLPGNMGIFHQLQKRIHERQKFVLFHADLDRFKVFNDHFGLAQGDKAIQKTADFLKKIMLEKGAADDFLGHQGGDDFIILTRPQKALELAEAVCSFFKTGVVLHLYSKEDYDRGYTMQLDRRRQTETGESVMVAFPLLSISLAGISNVKRDFADYADCMARVAPVKKDVKRIVESNYKIEE